MLSFHDRDPLAAEIAGFGWQVSSARRGENLRARFLSSNALVAVVDVRQDEKAGIAAISELSQLSQDGGIAILALAGKASESDIGEKAYDAGATHFLDYESPRADLMQAIRFAYRYVENIHGGPSAMQAFDNLLDHSKEKWSCSRRDFSQRWVSEPLRERLKTVDFDMYPITGIYRQLEADERQRVRGAMGRIRDGSSQAAVPHILNGKNVIHHLHASGDTFYGRIEEVASEKNVDDWTDRDLLSGLRKGSAARAWIKDRLTEKRSLGLIAFGLKNFQTINAAFGRPVGDQVLRIIGQRLLLETGNHSKDECLVARIDGHNFLMAATLDQSDDRFKEFARHLLATIFDPAKIDGRNIQLVPRAGISIEKAASDEALVIRRVSLTLAEAMASGSGLIKISSGSSADILLEQRLESELAEAIENTEITVVLQPQFKVRTGQLVGAEALARWDHPKFGLLGASTLFSVAERAGLLGILSQHIHKIALVAGANWPDSLSFLRLSINVTAGDLAEQLFVQKLDDRLKDTGFDPGYLTIEITESGLISDMAASVERLHQLRERGIRIAIDDFGTGYSSLSYLKDLPLDYLKIDSGLTGDISGSKKDQIVVRSIIDMAQNLDLAVVAEGVESQVQLETLAEQGCEFFQGFLRSGALLPEEFEIFALRSN
ncbi:putative bifunctional diguanylate cyclase/phosphodiesterase [Parasphingorhabdus halotolerans]|uniref:EAL domain-containing protein n=1 Tax=Parasphingorhabdus halotolerans TaxID=2725558 RepID=A0A6H2DKI2_9SPHN|nr:EAL domain-containing protein [Parasphingorhabdus halotolerans]QJB68166.1 EAL domain-containing protein [Parasphingorhabdus halotolerans]